MAYNLYTIILLLFSPVNLTTPLCSQAMTWADLCYSRSQYLCTSPRRPQCTPSRFPY